MPHCDLEPKATKLWAAKIKQAINIHMNILFHKANVYFLFNNKKFAERELPEAKALRLLSQCHQMANLRL